jgi:hypothetical protein
VKNTVILSGAKNPSFFGFPIEERFFAPLGMTTKRFSANHLVVDVYTFGSR